LENEKEAILERIKNIKLTEELLKLSQGHRDELELNADRILTRCQAVNVSVNTPRDEHQEIALQKVEEVIQSVVNQMQEDLTMAEAKIRGFLNACMPDESSHIGWTIGIGIGANSAPAKWENIYQS
jgi:biotin-(acetyl-CoA carboxylase) ligase